MTLAAFITPPVGSPLELTVRAVLALCLVVIAVTFGAMAYDVARSPRWRRVPTAVRVVDLGAALYLAGCALLVLACAVVVVVSPPWSL